MYTPKINLPIDIQDRINSVSIEIGCGLDCMTKQQKVRFVWQLLWFLCEQVVDGDFEVIRRRLKILSTTTETTRHHIDMNPNEDFTDEDRKA